MRLSSLRQQLTSLGADKLLGAAGPPVGIDFGAAGLKVLHISDSNNPALVCAAYLSTPEELIADPVRRLSFQIDSLPGLVRDCGLKAKRAACAIPASATICKHMRLPKAEGASLATVLKMAIPAQLGCDPGAVVHRHVEVGEVGRGPGAKTEVICFAAARDLVERLMKGLKAARLEPVGIHNEFQCMLKGLTALTRGAPPSGGATLYLDLGAAQTKAVIAHGTSMVFAKAIDFGGRTLDRAVADQLRVEMPQAHAERLGMTDLRAPRTAASSEASASSMAILNAAMSAAGMAETPRPIAEEPRTRRPDLSATLEMLTDELALCLRYHESVFPDKRVEKAIFLGGEARHTALCQHIARTLRLGAQVVDPLAGVTRTGKEPTHALDLRGGQPGWGVALGVCLSPTDL